LAQITGEPYAAESNRELSVGAARDAFARGADLVVLPELIVSGYGADAARLGEIAESLDGPSVAAWSKLADEHDGWIAAGLCERDGDRLFNSAVVVGADGVVLHYRKLHLFMDEKSGFEPGDLGLPLADLPFGRIGLCVCYDLRFVETARILALEGAELICVPTAWTAGFDQQRWDERGMAPQAHGAVLQANLNQVFIACASQAGHQGDLELLGSSLLAGPRGELLAGRLSGTERELALTEIDLDEAARAQTRHPLITPRADRRTDVYGLSIAGRVI
jgi:predicted amidohydrolase